jgi:hypothetical protein
MKKKKGFAVRALGSAVSLVLLAVVALGAVYISLNWQDLKGILPASISGFLERKSKAEGRVLYDFDAYSDSVYSGFGDMLLVASSVEAQLFKRNGELLCRFSINSPKPVVSIGKKSAAVWSVGGTEIYLADARGRQSKITAGEKLIAASVNDAGWVACVSGEQGYKGSVTVYDDSGASVYKVYLGSGYPVDADVAPSCRSVAVLSLTEAGSRLSLYSLDSEEERHSWTSGDTVYFDAEYLTENRVCLVSSRGVDLFGADCARLGGYEFDGEYLMDYSLDGGYIAMTLGKYKTGGSGRLVALDLNGKQTASLDISNTSGRIYCEPGGRYLSLLSGDGAALYTDDVVVGGRLENASGIKAAVVRGDGSAVIISGTGAAVFEPQK